jgi:nitrite reductase (NO-forming)
MQNTQDFDHFDTIDQPRRGFLTATAMGTIGASATLGLGAASGPALAQDTASATALGMATDDVDLAALLRIRQKLVAPPILPEHSQVATTGPRIIEVEMIVQEKLVKIDDDGDGATIWVFAYEGFVPGPMIVCHQGDYVELTLKSAASNVL